MRAGRSGFSKNSDGQAENGRNFKGEDQILNTCRQDLPENSLFYINSMIFNLENNKEEINRNFKCFYNPSLEALCILTESNTKYSDFSKEILMSLLEFSQKMGIKNIILLLDKKNKEYVKMVQAMMTVGFESDNQKKTAKINNVEYKILKMAMKVEEEEIEDVVF